MKLKKKILVALQRVKYKRRRKYMEGYNFLFFFFRGNRANGRNSEKRIDGGMIREI